MTVIVYRDGVIASDSQVIGRQWTTMGGFKKIGKRVVDGKVYLYGATGETSYAAKFERWIQSDAFLSFLKDGEGHPNLEPAARDEQCTGLLFTPEGACIRFEGNYPHYELTAPFFAFGTGDMVAMGALEMGATAQQAAQAAVVYDVLTNGEVQFLTAEADTLEDFKDNARVA